MNDNKVQKLDDDALDAVAGGAIYVCEREYGVEYDVVDDKTGQILFRCADERTAKSTLRGNSAEIIDENGLNRLQEQAFWNRWHGQG